MTELTLEALAKRLEALEKQLASQRSPHARLMAFLDTQTPCADIELVRQVHAEIAAAGKAEREAARAGHGDEPHVVE